MIFNSDITNRINEIFGEQSINWSKPIIRNALENKISLLSNKILSSSVGTDGELKMEYNKIKELDNDFMELYMEELE